VALATTVSLPSTLDFAPFILGGLGCLLLLVLALFYFNGRIAVRAIRRLPLASEIRKQLVVYKTIADTKWEGLEGLPRHAVRLTVRQSGLEIVSANVGRFLLPFEQHYMRGLETTMRLSDGPFAFGGTCIELFGEDDSGPVHLFLKPTDDMDELWQALLAAGVQPVEAHSC
jgi:hypothetical protein